MSYQPLLCLYSSVKRLAVHPNGFMLTLLLHILLVTAQVATAQHSSNQGYTPDPFSPAPEAAVLGKFGNYAVNHFTGVADISIPLYEIQVNGLKVPIVLRYHPSGIKISDRASWVGLGWALDVGGSVSRRVMGLPDELGDHGYLIDPASVREKTSINVLSQTDLDYINKVATGWIDAEPDIYSYSFGAESGQFIFDQKNSYAPIMIPSNPVKVKYAIAGHTMTFDLQNAVGDVYSFGSLDLSCMDWSTNGVSNVAATAWKPRVITSADRADTIKFNYSSSSFRLVDPYSKITLIDQLYTQPPGAQFDFLPTLSTGDEVLGQSTQDMVEAKVSDINYRFGKVVFVNSATNRLDIISNTGVKSLAEIQIFTGSNAANLTLLKKVVFTYSYFGSAGNNNQRLRLDALDIQDATGAIVQHYSFSYNALELPPTNSFSRDLWGYYNGVTNNSSLVPRTVVSDFQPYVSAPGTSTTIGSNSMNGRDPDPAFMQACMLTRITYPTGGWTDFTFETNQYVENSVTKYAGGLRIRQIKSYDGVSALPVTKTYVYNNGRKNFFDNAYSFITTFTKQHQNTLGPTTVGRVRTYTSNPTIDFMPYDGSPVAYSSVSVYNGDEVTNQGYDSYQYNDAVDALYAGFIGVTGKPIIQSRHFLRGQVLSKTDGPATETHTYGATQPTYTGNLGLVVFKTVITDIDTQSDVYRQPDNANAPGDAFTYVFDNYSLMVGDAKVTSTGNCIDNVCTNTNFFYENPLHQQVTKTTSTSSKGETITHLTKYPQDVVGQVYTDMATQYKIGYPVEETTQLNGVAMEKVTHNYAQFGPYAFMPATVNKQIQTGPNDLEATMTYNSQGKILSAQGRNNFTTRYLWGYQNSLPIAKVENATAGALHTSFEDLGTTDPAARTGFKVWNGTYAFTLPTTLGNYVISYWKKSVAAPTWVFVSQNLVVTAVNAGTASSVGVAGDILDEFRLYPAGALMTTYTYEPGKGMSSTMDANGLATYYSYDNFGRLSSVKDDKGNIVKHYVYQYKP